MNVVITTLLITLHFDPVNKSAEFYTEIYACSFIYIMYMFFRVQDIDK